ncbi:EVE domain-containing protein [Kribbella monticola]|uniref:hypothetical protein n=1 Tax=Kribbella monticola TaxID=2185285 RepID=UPI0013006B14|nr:hypothetical protein [Kribbella monticola]
MTRRVTADTLGGWILKCNPSLTDLPGLMANGVETWCVQDNYRSALFAAGQPVFLWITGPSGATPEPGIHAVGEIRGPAYWAAKYVVPLALRFLDAPLPRTEIAAQPALSTLEVLRQPHMSNPSFATIPEAGALRRLLAESLL